MRETSYQPFLLKKLLTLYFWWLRHHVLLTVRNESKSLFKVFLELECRRVSFPSQLGSDSYLLLKSHRKLRNRGYFGLNGLLIYKIHVICLLLEGRAAVLGQPNLTWWRDL